MTATVAKESEKDHLVLVPNQLQTLTTAARRIYAYNFPGVFNSQLTNGNQPGITLSIEIFRVISGRNFHGLQGIDKFHHVTTGKVYTIYRFGKTVL